MNVKIEIIINGEFVLNSCQTPLSESKVPDPLTITKYFSIFDYNFTQESLQSQLGTHGGVKIVEIPQDFFSVLYGRKVTLYKIRLPGVYLIKIMTFEFANKPIFHAIFDDLDKAKAHYYAK